MTIGTSGFWGKVSTQEMTDVTLQRPLDARTPRLKVLEAEVEAMQPLKVMSVDSIVWWALGALLAGGLLGLLVGAVMGRAGTLAGPVSLAAVVGISVLLARRRGRQKRAAAEHEARCISRIQDLNQQAARLLERT